MKCCKLKSGEKLRTQQASDLSGRTLPADGEMRGRELFTSGILLSAIVGIN